MSLRCRYIVTVAHEALCCVLEQDIFYPLLRTGSTHRRMAENGFAPPPLGNFADISYLVEN